MQYRILGRTGVKVSPLCLGTMNFGGRSDAAESGRILDQYIELGGNFVDTANVYNDGRSEEVIGDWMKKTGLRDRIVLSTKVHGRRSPHVNDAGNSRWHIVREVEQSLRRLKTERIDLYHIHRPDPDTPIDQTLRALDDLVRQGKVLYLASSVFAGWQLAEAHFLARELGTARLKRKCCRFAESMRLRRLHGRRWRGGGWRGLIRAAGGRFRMGHGTRLRINRTFRRASGHSWRGSTNSPMRITSAAASLRLRGVWRFRESRVLSLGRGRWNN
jgi:hypothetical protein